VIAEGVETGGQLHRVHNAGCKLVQGYYFSIPVNADGATRLLQQFPLDDPGEPFAA
jgi:EAL domain-containing protein (putative c-di-GMP-specific phosphodiesterase class I)